MLSARLAWVSRRKVKAEAALTAIGVDPSLPSKIAKTSVTKPPAGDPRFQWPLSGDAHFGCLWFRLLAGDKTGAPAKTGEFVNTDQAFAALTDASVISAASQTAAASARLLLQLRCLADVYARWEMAARVTDLLVGDQLSQPLLTKEELLARVLAYARAEGDLSIPPEDDTLQGTDPGAASGIALPPGRSRFGFALTFSAYMYCVTFVAVARDRPDVPFPAWFVPGFLTGWDLSDPATFAKAADFSFTAVLGGLDILWVTGFQTAAEELAPGSGPFVPTGQFDWPALNRGLAGGLADPKGAAQADYNTRMKLLTATTVVTGPPDVWRTSACASSAYTGDYSGAGAHYAALVVSEGIRYMNRLTYGPTRFGAGADIETRLPEILVYLWYHKGDQGAGVLSSAGGSALRPKHTTAYSTALATALRNCDAYTPSLETTLGDVWRSATTEGSTQIAKDNWGDIAPLLGDKTVVEPLADYIRNEGETVWKGWAKHRPNCIGYAQLYDYLVYQLTGRGRHDERPGNQRRRVLADHVAGWRADCVRRAADRRGPVAGCRLGAAGEYRLAERLAARPDHRDTAGSDGDRKRGDSARGIRRWIRRERRRRRGGKRAEGARVVADRRAGGRRRGLCAVPGRFRGQLRGRARAARRGPAGVADRSVPEHRAPLAYGIGVLLTLVTPQAKAPQQPPVTGANGQVLRSAYQLPSLNLNKIGALLRDPATFMRGVYLAAGSLATPDDVAAFADALFPVIADALNGFGIGASYGLDPFFDQLGLDAATTALLQHGLTFWLLDSSTADAVSLGATVALLGPDASTNNQVAAVVAPFFPSDFSPGFLGGWDLTLSVNGGAPLTIVGWSPYPADPATWPGLDFTLTLTLGQGPARAAAVGRQRRSRQRGRRRVRRGRRRLRCLGGLLAGTGRAAQPRAVGQRGVGDPAGRFHRAGHRVGGPGRLRRRLPRPCAARRRHQRARLARSLRLGQGRDAARLGEPGQRDRARHVPRRHPRAAHHRRRAVRGHSGARWRDCRRDVQRHACLRPADRHGRGPRHRGRGGVAERRRQRRPFNVAPGVVWPTGAGLAIDAGPVTGGGFATFDKQHGQYAGVLQLALESLGLTALGLIQTKNADGTPMSGGFSLVVLIDVQFLPGVELGMGFSLNGVGGLLGLNRTMNADALRAGVRSGALADIMFPGDPIGNAPQLIKELSGFFPAAPGRFLIGPMVQIDWGSPDPILTAELGVIIELPAPVRIAILGVLQVALPEQGDDAVVELNLDALGVLDLGQGQFSLDASLYDSTIVEFSVTGDMAMRLGWKAAKEFLVSIGGFHPAYTPPAGFPALSRLALIAQHR